MELEAERRVQQNAGRLLDTAAASFESLYESPESALSLVRTVAKRFDELAKIDEQMAGMRQAIEPALIAIQDVSYSLRDYLGRMEANPARLEEIESAARSDRQAEAEVRQIGGRDSRVSG